MGELGTRAVAKLITAGAEGACVHCNVVVKFQAKKKARRVICNVYVDGRWDRLEIFHYTCYQEAGEPHGPAVTQLERHEKSIDLDALEEELDALEKSDPEIKRLGQAVDTAVDKFLGGST